MSTRRDLLAEAWRLGLAVDHDMTDTMLRLAIDAARKEHDLFCSRPQWTPGELERMQRRREPLFDDLASGIGYFDTRIDWASP